MSDTTSNNKYLHKEECIYSHVPPSNGSFDLLMQCNASKDTTQHYTKPVINRPSSDVDISAMDDFAVDRANAAIASLSHDFRVNTKILVDKPANQKHDHDDVIKIDSPNNKEEILLVGTRPVQRIEEDLVGIGRWCHNTELNNRSVLARPKAKGFCEHNHAGLEQGSRYVSNKAWASDGTSTTNDKVAADLAGIGAWMDDLATGEETSMVRVKHRQGSRQ